MKVANNKVDIENLHPALIEIINDIEGKINEELIITSGFRSATHPIEARKARPGTHNGDGVQGYAVDVASVGGPATFSLVEAAISSGIKRIGISRKSNFVHIDIADRFENKVTSIWTY